LLDEALLGCIASATAPAATFDTVLESGSKSPFSRLLLAIVAIGMALLTAGRFPEYQQTILSIVISTTVFFELVGAPSSPAWR
jgi:hypothetical protein